MFARQELCDRLDEVYDQLFRWLDEQEDELFAVHPIEGKWSTGQHARHLVQSTTAVNQGMRMPLMALRTMFGVSNREERSYEQLVAKYQAKLVGGGAAGGRFLPEEVANEQKMAILDDLRQQLSELKAITGRWKEVNLSKFLLPHPLIGKLTIREVLYFTIYHTGHHLRILQEKYPKSK